MQLEKVYEPQRFEPHWAQWWIDRNLYRANAKEGDDVFCLVIPPPNVTGSLHMGHMLEHAEIDVTIRWNDDGSFVLRGKAIDGDDSLGRHAPLFP